MRDQLTAATLVFRPFSLQQALEGIATTGFKQVELGTVKDWLENIDPLTVTDDELAQIREQMDDRGLTPVSLSAHAHLHTDEGYERFRKSLGVAENLGMLIVNTFTGDAETPEEREKFFDNIQKLADYASELGLTIAIETDSNLLPSAKEGLWIIDRIDRPNVRLNYDTGNVIYYAGERPEEDIKRALPYLAHVHLKDKVGGKGVFNFPPLGTGDIDVPAILQTLQEADFRGPISVEVEFDEQGWPDYETCLEALQGSWAYLDSLEVVE